MPDAPATVDENSDATAALRFLFAWYKRLPPGAALGVAGAAAFFSMIRFVPAEIVGEARIYTVNALDIFAVSCALAAAYAIIREVIRRA